LIEAYVGRLGFQRQINVRSLTETARLGEGTENDDPLAGDGPGQNFPELSADLGAQTLASLQPFLLHLFQQSRHEDNMGSSLRGVKSRAPAILTMGWMGTPGEGTRPSALTYL
jgi:hypothetical protein